MDRLEALTARPDFWDDPDRAQQRLRERAELAGRLERFERVVRETQSLRELLALAESEGGGDASLVEEIAAQLPELERQTRALELERMLGGKEDRSDAIVSIHPGAGGIDAQDWAQMLLRMYLRWCERRGLQVELLDQQPGDEAGIKSASFVARGPYAYGLLRAENGVHRLIRISPFDANARRHTAFAAVYVVPDLDEDDTQVVIRPEDIQVDTFRAGGKGGQHVNKTESAVRITHLPTGIVVSCQAERSQHKNRATAMKMLRGRLYEMQRAARESEFQQAYGVDRSTEIAFGSQVRTYTLHPYTLVKDERTEHKTGNAQAVLDGDLDPFIEAYLLAAADRRAARERSPSTPTAEARG
ncbi:MAG: peptide chain release factor 2 [Myxococcales bacterium]|nr:peptide chain release factor 2 [Myxococcales bacterium]